MKKKYLLIISLLLIESTIYSKKLRWGILSTARFNKPILDAIALCKGHKVTAIASRDIKKAQAFAKEHNIGTAYGSYEELLSDPEIDVIFNPLPNSLHGFWTAKALQAGKHVLCEKPLVITLKDFELIEESVRKNKKIVIEGLTYLYHPQTKLMLDLIASGKIGDINLINAKLHIQLDTGHLADKPVHGEIRLDTKLGGGSLWDLGIYCSSIILLIAQNLGVNELEKLYCSALYSDSGVDIATQCILKFNKKLLASFSTNFYSPFSAGLTIVGTKGRIELNGPWHPGFFEKNDVTIIYDNGKKEVINMPIGNPYVYEILEMERAILNKVDPICYLDLSKKFLITLLDLQKSAKDNIAN